jgi:cytochrome c553
MESPFEPLVVGRSGRPPDPDRTRQVAMRECRNHGTTEFGRYSNGAGRLRWVCKRCSAEAVTRRHQKVKRLLVAEAGGRCAVCGYGRTILSLHFHHVDPASKSFPMSMATGKSLAAYRSEASKCILVCANCHGEIEAGLIPSPPPRARWGEEWVPVGRAPEQSPPEPSSGQAQLRLVEEA